MSSRVRKLMEYDEKNPAGAGSGDAEHLILYGLLRMLKPDSVLEIGVSRGHMTTWLALALAENGKGKLTSVDNWSRAHGGEATSPSYALKRLNANGLNTPGLVEFVGSDSVEFLKAQKDSSFDFIWVDGDHSFEGAKADINESLRVGSRMIGAHDTAQQYSGVRDAIAEISREEHFQIENMFVRGGRGIWLCER